MALYAKDAAQKINEIKQCMIRDDLLLFTTYVNALKSALEKMEMGEIDAILAGLPDSDKVQKIKENVLMFEYDEAVRLLAEDWGV